MAKKNKKETPMSFTPDTTNLTRRACKALFEASLDSLMEVARVAGAIPMNRSVVGDVEQAHLILRYIEKNVLVEDDGTDIGARVAERFAYHLDRVRGYGSVFPTLPKEDRVGPTGGGRKPMSDDEKAAKLFKDA